MKVKQRVSHQDGTITESEIIFQLNHSSTDPCWTLVEESGEPFAIRILKSGWKDHGETMYHVLTEWGAYEETTYSHLSESQLLERYPDFNKVLKSTDLILSSSDIINCPNDLELGKKIRKLLIKDEGNNRRR